MNKKYTLICKTYVTILMITVKDFRQVLYAFLTNAYKSLVKQKFSRGNEGVSVFPIFLRLSYLEFVIVFFHWKFIFYEYSPLKIGISYF